MHRYTLEIMYSSLPQHIHKHDTHKKQKKNKQTPSVCDQERVDQTKGSLVIGI